MEIMKNITYILLFFLLGCVANKSDMKIESNHSKSIDATIERARLEIYNHLKNNGFNSKEVRMIFKSMGQSEGNSEEERCKVFHQQVGYDFIKQNIKIGNNWVTAMILDKKGNYIAKSSPHTLITNPEHLNAYPLELKMIEIARKENYLTYIELMNCNENYIIGYKKDVVDVYKYTDDELILVYKK